MSRSLAIHSHPRSESAVACHAQALRPKPNEDAGGEFGLRKSRGVGSWPRTGYERGDARLGDKGSVSTGVTIGRGRVATVTRFFLGKPSVFMDRFYTRRDKLRSGWRAAGVESLLVSATVERQLLDRVQRGFVGPVGQSASET